MSYVNNKDVILLSKNSGFRIISIDFELFQKKARSLIRLRSESSQLFID